MLLAERGTGAAVEVRGRKNQTFSQIFLRGGDEMTPRSGSGGIVPRD